MQYMRHPGTPEPALSAWVEDYITGGVSRWWGPAHGPRERLAATVRPQPPKGERFIVSVWPPHGSALLTRVPCPDPESGKRQADEALQAAGLLHNPDGATP